MTVRDDELVTAALAGDATAFAALVERNRSQVEAVVERMTGGEAEDLAQEALLRAYLGLSQLRDPARFGAWLCGIAVNLTKMRLRRRALEARVFAEPTIDEDFEDRELLRLVRDAVDVLPAGQREVVLMYYIDDLSRDEIAALSAARLAPFVSACTGRASGSETTSPLSHRYASRRRRSE